MLVSRREKYGQLENVKEISRVAMGKRTEKMQLKDISKAVTDLTGELAC